MCVDTCEGICAIWCGCISSASPVAASGDGWVFPGISVSNALRLVYLFICLCACSCKPGGGRCLYSHAHVSVRHQDVLQHPSNELCIVADFCAVHCGRLLRSSLLPQCKASVQLTYSSCLNNQECKTRMAAISSCAAAANLLD